MRRRAIMESAKIDSTKKYFWVSFLYQWVVCISGTPLSCSSPQYNTLLHGGPEIPGKYSFRQNLKKGEFSHVFACKPPCLLLQSCPLETVLHSRFTTSGSARYHVFLLLCCTSRDRKLYKLKWYRWSIDESAENESINSTPPPPSFTQNLQYRSIYHL